MNRFYIKQGDTKPDLVVELRRKDGTQPDLATATVNFRMRPRRGGITISKVAQKDADLGRARVQWVAGDTDIPGSHLAEFEVVQAGGATETFPNNGYLDVQIEEEIG